MLQLYSMNSFVFPVILYMDNGLSFQPKLWPHCGKNSASVGELWTGLFKFYTEEFKIDEYVVCIRQQEPLTRFEKLWNGKCVAIEGKHCSCLLKVRTIVYFYLWIL